MYSATRTFLVIPLPSQQWFNSVIIWITWKRKIIQFNFIVDISTKPEKFGDLDDVAVPVSTRIKNA